MIEINLPHVVAEVTACCEAYETALVSNNVAALQGFFWDSPHSIRFGLGEQLYGAEAISAFRAQRVINFNSRKVLRLTVLALGLDVASAMLEFSVNVDGRGERHGRQTQTWARIPHVGWRVVTAHVSHQFKPVDPWETYAESASNAIGLPLPPVHREGVTQNLKRAAAIAAPLLNFALPADVEAAPVFEP